MINVLIADDNVHYATYLMNQLNKNNHNIKVCAIAKDGKETLEIINDEKSIDVILLDFKMPIYNGDEILEKINNKKKYEKSCIIITGEIGNIKQQYNNDMIYTTIYKTIKIEDIVNKINELLEYKEKVKRERLYKSRILKEIQYLNYDISLKGTKYLIDTIEYIILNSRKNPEKLERDVYPEISKKYNESIHNIKCNINRANNMMYCQCEIERLKEYFKFEKDIKPKPKLVINTIVNKIQNY